MKKTFFNISAEKKQALIFACIKEFSIYGYEKGSTDRIVKYAGISKGGLYEYIESKESLFLYIVDYCYRDLYDFLFKQIRERNIEISIDILERFKQVAILAFDYYEENIEIIELISKTSKISDPLFLEKINLIFQKYFNQMFGNVDSKILKFPKKKVLDLLKWLLIKTRDDFLMHERIHEEKEKIKKYYFDEWNFYIKVLAKGIYQE